MDTGHKLDAFSGKQISQVIRTVNMSSLEGLRNFAMIGLIATTGFRTIEVVRANIKNLRLNAGETCIIYSRQGECQVIRAFIC